MLKFVRCGLTVSIWSLRRAKFVFWVLVVTPLALWATDQIPDQIRIDDTDAPLCMTPILAPYFAEHPDRDIARSKGESYKACEPGRDSDDGLIELSTRLWRRYVASFAIVDNQLVVEQIWTDNFGGEDEEWAPVIDCAMPEPESRRLDWFSGPLYFMRNDPVDGDSEEREEYSLFQIDIEHGRYMGTKKIRSEIHGPSSWVSCSAGWDEEPVEGPIVFGWCQVDSIDATCEDQSRD
jgi:hypothetical protein